LVVLYEAYHDARSLEHKVLEDLCLHHHGQVVQIRELTPKHLPTDTESLHHQ